MVRVRILSPSLQCDNNCINNKEMSLLDRESQWVQSFFSLMAQHTLQHNTISMYVAFKLKLTRSLKNLMFHLFKGDKKYKQNGKEKRTMRWNFHCFHQPFLCSFFWCFVCRLIICFFFFVFVRRTKMRNKKNFQDWNEWKYGTFDSMPVQRWLWVFKCALLIWLDSGAKHEV